MIVLEQGSEADGASPQEARGSQARLRLQEATRGTGQYYFPSLQFLAPSGAKRSGYLRLSACHVGQSLSRHSISILLLRFSSCSILSLSQQSLKRILRRTDGAYNTFSCFLFFIF